MPSLRSAAFVLVLLLLSGCLPLPIAIQPYSSPITDGLALGNVEIRETNGIEPQAAQAIIDEVLGQGFIPLLYSGDGQSTDKLKYHIGETLAGQGSSPGRFNARVDSLVDDTVAISISLPESRPLQDEPAAAGSLQCRVSFSNTRWNAGRDLSWTIDDASWHDQSRLIELDWEISGFADGQDWSLRASQPALRASFHGVYGGYGWFNGESPYGVFQIAY